MKLKTTLLQSLVARAIKGASMNKMLPITSLMAIELKDNKLRLTTTDGTNYLYVGEDKVEGDDFYVVVTADIFAKLVAKMTCEYISIDIDHNFNKGAVTGGLTVVGNGTYSLEIPLDEDGEMVKYPDPAKAELNTIDCGEIKLSTVKYILATAKSALAQTNEIECYTGYYVGDSVIATDTYKICNVDIKLFNKPALVRAETFDLLDTFIDESIEYERANDVIVFKSGNDCIYSPLMDSIDSYQVDAIMSLVETDMPSVCSVSKVAMMQLLDRLSLFVSPYDKNGIYLTFTRTGMQVDSKKANSTEVVEYKSSENFQNFTCCIDIEMLRTQIKSTVNDLLTIRYGDNSAIQIVDGNTTQVIALLDDDR